MKKNFSKLLIMILLAPFTLSPARTEAAYNNISAQSYLLNHSQNPWSTMALAALNSNSISTDYLNNFSASSAIDYEAPILAIAAVGKNPQNFNNKNLTEELKNFYISGQLGDPNAINDDIFGLLAFSASKLTTTDTVVSGVKQFILQNQNPDGGWSYSTGGTSDSNTTASAITALAAFGSTASDTYIQSALTYLHTAQNSDGGFTYDPRSSYGTASDSSSTAWVLWALNSLGINPDSWTNNGNTPEGFLNSLQSPNGYFEYQAGAGENSFSAITTAYAVIALSHKTLPVFSANSDLIDVQFRIEGSQETVCSGHTQAVTAMDVVKNAADQCGFAYTVAETSFGPYLKAINGDAASGQTGWMYLVNFQSPDVGAFDYKLKNTDEVLWYFGDWGLKPTRLTLPQTEISSNQNASVVAEFYQNGSWQALNEATVSAGISTTYTNTQGEANLSLTDGYYKVVAEKSGYIRSNQVLLKVGSPGNATVSLITNINGGEVAGTSTPPSVLAFTVDTSSLDFGSLKPGESAQKNLTIKNNGTLSLQIQSYVSGDPVFTDRLSINEKTWQQFSTELSSQEKQEESLKLVIPSSYTGTSGQKTGQLIFWASAK